MGVTVQFFCPKQKLQMLITIISAVHHQIISFFFFILLTATKKVDVQHCFCFVHPFITLSFVHKISRKVHVFEIEL